MRGTQIVSLALLGPHSPEAFHGSVATRLDRRLVVDCDSSGVMVASEPGLLLGPSLTRRSGKTGFRPLPAKTATERQRLRVETSARAPYCECDLQRCRHVHRRARAGDRRWLRSALPSGHSGVVASSRAREPGLSRSARDATTRRRRGTRVRAPARCTERGRLRRGDHATGRSFRG